MKIIRDFFVYLLSLLFFIGPVFANNLTEFEVMFYNVENLFDTEHDEGKDDWTFTPKKLKGKKEACRAISNPWYRKQCQETDWIESKLNLKIDQIYDVVSRKNNKVVDFLGLCEVENEKVIQRLAKRTGHEKWVISRGPDVRGINVALLYRDRKEFKLIKTQEHLLDLVNAKSKPTRSILEVEFLFKERDVLIFLLNHWPSQGNPSSTRLAAAEKVLTIIKTRHKERANINFVVMGDFNTIADDYPHPFHRVLLQDDLLVDLHSAFMKESSLSYSLKNSMPLGTYFYAPKMKWDLLDRFFISKNLLQKKSKIKVDIGSYQIYAPSWLGEDYTYDKEGYHRKTKIKGVPKAYNFEVASKKHAGYSDHFPILFKFSLQ